MVFLLTPSYRVMRGEEKLYTFSSVSVEMKKYSPLPLISALVVGV